MLLGGLSSPGLKGDTRWGSASFISQVRTQHNNRRALWSPGGQGAMAFGASRPTMVGHVRLGTKIKHLTSAWWFTVPWSPPPHPVSRVRLSFPLHKFWKARRWPKELQEERLWKLGSKSRTLTCDDYAIYSDLFCDPVYQENSQQRDCGL